ncbi:Similar to Metacaspase-1; acc. no. O74477 [Pyronema omphalodes CBS 100304]|uniref:Similar to Metacaspase-1 acc. no. O74477 n=1 Tax=Pyronema omphalodes (strain CBS 100304) TaxID=1076935 RepID=U4KUL3_PYROM|nr:Similar to Metacaspase-1; acc. no. O74477 [Pyronema omphalodes CBS 100304]
MAQLQPTRKNILSAMKWLVDDAQPNDSLFLFYSGHGSQVIDRDGDQVHGKDEAICPLDTKAA